VAEQAQMVSGGVVRNGGQALLAGEVGCVDQGAESVSGLPGPDSAGMVSAASARSRNRCWQQS
jgi:hypothetical protein